MAKRLVVIWVTIFTGTIGAAWVSQAIGGSHRMLIGALTAGTLGGVFELVVESFVTERLRPYFLAYIKEHRDEITRMTRNRKW